MKPPLRDRLQEAELAWARWKTAMWTVLATITLLGIAGYVMYMARL